MPFEAIARLVHSACGEQQLRVLQPDLPVFIPAALGILLGIGETAAERHQRCDGERQQCGATHGCPCHSNRRRSGTMMTSPWRSEIIEEIAQANAASLSTVKREKAILEAQELLDLVHAAGVLGRLGPRGVHLRRVRR